MKSIVLDICQIPKKSPGAASSVKVEGAEIPKHVRNDTVQHLPDSHCSFRLRPMNDLTAKKEGFRKPPSENRAESLYYFASETDSFLSCFEPPTESRAETDRRTGVPDLSVTISPFGVRLIGVVGFTGTVLRFFNVRFWS